MLETMYPTYEPLHTLGWALAANHSFEFIQQNVNSANIMVKQFGKDYEETLEAFNWAKVNKQIILYI